MSAYTNIKSSEDNTNYKAISCEKIPELFLDKIVAKKHFSKFGKIKKFILRPKRLSCSIEYENKEDASNAFLKAGNFNGIDFVVTYAQHEVAHVQNTEEWVDPEVQAELEAMCPGLRFDIAPRTASMQKSSGLDNIFQHANNMTFPLKFIKTVSTNRQNSPQPVTPKIDSLVRQEMQNILKMPAFTGEDKYKVLDARDKLIRLTSVRQTDIKKAVATKGTCPDMCPEKERLMREFQRQISIFEMTEEENGGTAIAHKKAVKEYSRSSADQEVPLPHELRSESVLKMTMLYLVHCIMGLCDDPKTSLCEWFHFLWDRTRSIRKDITQQELCSLEAVQLVEQCARFHIHCSARLVAEDPSVFDKKINAENLTKCLQTLKYMYHDLRIKGVVCPCEAEFRSYVILLNLGDSNFLWELKQLPEFIQKSVEIKRAIAFYNALQNNNFVKFFSMINSPNTSYLSACILLGYFTKLRVRAMDAIIKSHNWRKNDVYLPLSYLTSILGFEDESAAVSFFKYYGLHCDVLDTRVLLDRLKKPNIEYVMNRALELVESKRHVSVGECVFGQRLPSASLFDCHQPYNSFDENGLFKIDSLGTDHQLMESYSTVKIQSKPLQSHQYENVISKNDINLFKIPQTMAISSGKQQKKLNILQKHIVEERKEHSLHPLSIKKEDKSPLPSRFTFFDNSFSEGVFTKPVKEPIFKAPSFITKSEQESFQFCVKSPAEKSLTIMGDISSNAQSKSENIFGIAVRETAGLFQRQKKVLREDFQGENSLKEYKNGSDNTFANKNVLGEYEKSTEKIFFPIVLNEAVQNGSKQKYSSEIKLDIKGAVGNVKKEEFEQIEEDKLSNLEFKQVRENRKLQEDYEKEINRINEKAVETTELLIHDLIEAEIIRLVQTEVLISQTVIEASEIQVELLINEVVNIFVEDIANEEYAIMCYDQLLLNRYFTRWLLHVRRKKEQKKLIEDIPLYVTTNTRCQYAKALQHPCQQKNMGMITRYRFGKPKDLHSYFNIDSIKLYDDNENPLNLYALVGQHLLTKRNFTSCGILQQRKYFKFLITLPGDKEELLGFESFASKCLIKLIGKNQNETDAFVNGIEHDVALCVRKLTGIVPKNEQGSKMTTEGDHNDGVLCFISGTEIDTHSRTRIYNLLKATKNLKRVPLAIIAYNCKYNREELAKLLGLDVLQEEGLIYSYIILGCAMKRRELNFRELFICAVNFITKESYLLNSNEMQALAMENILSFLETSLGEEMWQRWCDSAKTNPIFNKICNLPTHVLGIFHKALDHLTHITKEDFNEMPEFPEELKKFVPENSCCNIPLGLEFFPINWKDETAKNVISSFLQRLYLPHIGEVPNDIETLKLWLVKYSSKCVRDDELAATKASHESISNLVNQIKCLKDVELSSTMRMINYLTVFKPIAFAHINEMLMHFKYVLGNLKVIYLKDDLKNYQTQPWWLNYEPLNLVTVDYNEASLNLPATLQLEYKESLNVFDEIDKVIVEAEEKSRKFEQIMSDYTRKRRTEYNNSVINLSSISQMKRTLDDSLYHFELSKKVGQYDTSFVAELTDDIENCISNGLKQSAKSQHKRKCYQYSDVGSVIAKATKLIHDVESVQDKKFRRKMY